MNHRQLHSRTSNLVLALGCAAAIGACGGAERRHPETGGAGGGSGGSGGGNGGSGGSGGLVSSGGSGGSSAGGGSGGNAGSGGSGSGGAAGSGGSSKGGSGGNAEGGSGGSTGGAGGGSGGSGGGAGGAGGTTVAPKACSNNDECSGGTCDPILKICVQCQKSSDCSNDGHCLGGTCVSFTSCSNSRDCGSADLVCDPNRGICVECAGQGDCGDKEDCVFNKCVSTAGCESNDNCNGKLCDTTAKRCVECLGDGDCGSDSGKKCGQGVCRTACTSDKQCTPQNMLCDTALSGCVQCKANTDCPSSMYCEGGACKADICDSTQSTCADNGVAACNDASNGWATPKSCGSQGCQASGGVAICGGPLPGDGGGQPDTNPVDGGQTDTPMGCTTEKANPCTSIPKYNGTQVVDGKDDDMCQVPSFTFNRAVPGVVINNYNNIQDSEFPVVTARVAWAADGLHTFFDVADASLQSVAMKDPTQATQRPYQGDSIELFFSSNDTATGAPGGDAGAVHITFGATGPSVAVKVTNSGGIATTYTDLPPAQFKAVKTDAGWAIEALLPWQGGAPSGGGKARFDLAVNVADTNCAGVDDMRDAQMILNQSSVSGQTSCPGGAEPWCDDRTWCSATLQE